MKTVRYLKDLDEIENNRQARINTIVEWYENTLVHLQTRPYKQKDREFYLQTRADELLEMLRIPDEYISEEK